MVSDSDFHLVQRILNSERDLYQGIVESNMSMVAAIVRKRVGLADVNGVAHDIFVRAYGSLAAYRGEQPFSHWLSKIAVRECIDIWRRQRRNREQSVSELSTAQQAWLDGLQATDGAEERRLAVDTLQWAMGKLSPEDRAVVHLVHIEGHSVSEAAQLLGWSRVNVKVRAHRARVKLKKIVMDS